MDRIPEQALQIGDWRLEPGSGLLSPAGASDAAGQDEQRLDARPLRLLVYLAGRAGETIGMDELLEQVWPGVVVTQDSVYQAITALRRALGDDSKQPRYIATVPRQGYRLIAAVQTLPAVAPGLSASAATEALRHAETTSGATTSLATEAATPSSGRRPRWPLPLVALLTAIVLILLAGIALWQRHASAPTTRSLAVLPFLDLTDAMDAEPLADGMSEQLIDVLGRHRELQVQARSRVFAYKGRDWPATRIGQELGVAHVLEGSIRGDAKQLRISAQLVQVSDGKVRWSASYDRPRSELLKLQGEVAQQIEQAVGGALDSGIAR